MRQHLIWIYADRLDGKLDAATWLDTSRELRALGWQVTLIAAGPSDARFIRQNSVLCISKPDIYLVRQLVFHLRVLRLLVQKWDSTDVILVHAMSAPWVLPLRLVRRVKGRGPVFVMDTRTLPMTRRDKESWRDRVRRIYLLHIEKWGSDWSDGRVAITQRMADALEIPTEKLWGVWSSGVNLEQFAPAQTLRQWVRDGEPVHLMYIGVLDHARNLLPLAHAVEQANRQGMRYLLSLVGAGPQRGELEEFAVATEGRVRIVPPVPHNHVWEILAQAHVGVLPFPDEDKFRVSSPVKLFEYMAAGLPILATRIVSHTDVMAQSPYVFWIQEADEAGMVDALRNVWHARTDLKELGAQAAEAAAAWTWQESARKLGRALETGLVHHPNRKRTN